jgi:hypothetical protein
MSVAGHQCYRAKGEADPVMVGQIHSIRVSQINLKVGAAEALALIRASLAGTAPWAVSFQALRVEPGCSFKAQERYRVK